MKRCIGIPGDTILIRNAIVFVNGKRLPEYKTQQSSYTVSTGGTTINPLTFERMNISREDQKSIPGGYELPLTADNAGKIGRFTNVTGIKQILADSGYFAPIIFPYSKTLKWNVDNLGPLWIPSKGPR